MLTIDLARVFGVLRANSFESHVIPGIKRVRRLDGDDGVPSVFVEALNVCHDVSLVALLHFFLNLALAKRETIPRFTLSPLAIVHALSLIHI